MALPLSLQSQTVTSTPPPDGQSGPSSPHDSSNNSALPRPPPIDLNSNSTGKTERVPQPPMTHILGTNGNDLVLPVAPPGPGPHLARTRSGLASGLGLLNKNKSPMVASNSNNNAQVLSPKFSTDSPMDPGPHRPAPPGGKSLNESPTVTKHTRTRSDVSAFESDNGYDSGVDSGFDSPATTPKPGGIEPGGASLVGAPFGLPSGKFQSSIRCAVRKRPRRPKEADEPDVCQVSEGISIAVYEPKKKVDGAKVVEPVLFHFDHVFDEFQSNQVVYDAIGKPLLDTVFRGNNAIAFAFGQTGSGKTHTMFGSPDGKEPGIYSLASKELLDSLEASAQKMKLVVSFYEIYAGKLYDLLNDRNKITTLEDEYKNLNLVGLTQHGVTDYFQLMEMIKVGNLNRASGQTNANDRSSRSHAVLVLNIKTPAATNQGVNGGGAGGAGYSVGGYQSSGGVSASHIADLGKQWAKLTFVDLAGSERGADTTGLDKKTRMEGAEINKSLLALKECIRALDQHKKHIPFRGSKLTQVLRDSFIGQSTTLMISNISPCQSHCEDTLNSLRYANRIKELKQDDGAGGNQLASIPCANCGLPIFSNSKDQHTCSRQMVKCQHCRKNIDQSKLEAHLKECSEAAANCPHCGVRCIQATLKKHLKKCGKAPALCKLCGDKVLRDDMKIHQESKCQQAKVPCNYCKALVVKCDLVTHLETCNVVPVNCPECQTVVRRGKLTEHIASCPTALRKQRQQTHFAPNVNQNSALQGLTPPKELPPLIQVNGGGPKPGFTRRRSATHLNRHPSASRNRPSASINRNSSPMPHETGQLPRGNRRAMTPPTQRRATSPRGPPGRMGGGGGMGGESSGCKYCGKATVLGSKETHLQNHCTGYPIDCSFADFGCKVRVARGKMPAHLRDAILTHMELMRCQTSELQKENNQLKMALAKAEHERDITSVEATPEEEELSPEELELRDSFYSPLPGDKPPPSSSPAPAPPAGDKKPHHTRSGSLSMSGSNKEPQHTRTVSLGARGGVGPVSPKAQSLTKRNFPSFERKNASHSNSASIKEESLTKVMDLDDSQPGKLQSSTALAPGQSSESSPEDVRRKLVDPEESGSPLRSWIPIQKDPPAETSPENPSG